VDAVDGRLALIHFDVQLQVEQREFAAVLRVIALVRLLDRIVRKVDELVFFLGRIESLVH